MHTPRELQNLYQQGKNISEILREERGITHNSDEIIEIAYDLQSGSYTADMDDPAMAKYKANYTTELAKTILSLCKPTSILEAGIGEATTLSGVIQNIDHNLLSYSFDLSWSRVAYARNWLQKCGISNASLCTGNLTQIPFLDNSIEVVYTSHSIEPNGGNERVILEELYRVTGKYLILLEPGYELANEDARRRMDSHGYCRNLKGIATELNYNVILHQLFPYSSNPLNPTAITIIEKDYYGNKLASSAHACPKFKVPLEEFDGMLFSPEALMAYPIINGIPCLRVENGIFASKYKEVVQGL